LTLSPTSILYSWWALVIPAEKINLSSYDMYAIIILTVAQGVGSGRSGDSGKDIQVKLGGNPHEGLKSIVSEGWNTLEIL